MNTASRMEVRRQHAGVLAHGLLTNIQHGLAVVVGLKSPGTDPLTFSKPCPTAIMHHPANTCIRSPTPRRAPPLRAGSRCLRQPTPSWPLRSSGSPRAASLSRARWARLATVDARQACMTNYIEPLSNRMVLTYLHTRAAPKSSDLNMHGLPSPAQGMMETFLWVPPPEGPSPRPSTSGPEGPATTTTTSCGNQLEEARSTNNMEEARSSTRSSSRDKLGPGGVGGPVMYGLPMPTPLMLAMASARPAAQGHRVSLDVKQISKIPSLPVGIHLPMDR